MDNERTETEPNPESMLFSINRYLAESEDATVPLGIAVLVGWAMEKAWSRGGIYWPSNTGPNRHQRRKEDAALRRAYRLSPFAALAAVESLVESGHVAEEDGVSALNTLVREDSLVVFDEELSFPDRLEGNRESSSLTEEAVEQALSRQIVTEVDHARRSITVSTEEE